NSIVCSCNVRVNVISLLFTNTTHFRSWACFLQGISEVCQRNPANGSIVHNKVSQENALDRRRLLLPFRRPGIPNCRCDGCPVARSEEHTTELQSRSHIVFITLLVILSF